MFQPSFSDYQWFCVLLLTRWRQSNDRQVFAKCRRIWNAIRRSLNAIFAGDLDYLSTQPSRIAHNLAVHHRAAHSSAVRWFGCVQFATQTAMQLVSTLVQRQYYRSDVGPTLAQPTLLSDWLSCEEGYPYGWRTQPSQHTTEPLGCVTLGGVLLGCVQFGMVV